MGKQARWLATVMMLLIVGSGAARAAPDAAALKEAQQLSEHVEQLYAHGRFAEALPIAKRALDIRERVLGPEHSDTAVLLNQLGRLYSATANYDEAESLLLRALAIDERVLGPEHLETATSLDNLASLYNASGAAAKAEPLARRALATTEKALGPTHPRTATLSKNLAQIYANLGDYARAEPLQVRAIDILEKVLGREHPDIAPLLGNLGNLYFSTGAYDRAEPLYQRMLAIFEKTQGPQSPRTAAALGSLASLYVKTGAYDKAEPLFQRAIAIVEQAMGPEHPNLAVFLNNLGIMYLDLGSYSRADAPLQRALTIKEKVLGAEHPSTASTINNLAELYRANGEYARAEASYRRVIAIYTTAYGPAYPTIVEPLNNLAALYWQVGERAKALPLLQQVQVIRAKNSDRFLLAGSEARKHAYLQALLDDTSMNVSFSVALSTPDSTKLGLTSVLQYKGRVLDAVADNVALLRRSVQPRDRAVFEQLAEVATQLSALTYQGAGQLSAAAYRQRVDKLGQQQEALQVQLAKRSSDFRRQVSPVTLAAVRSALPEDAALVEWFRFTVFDPAQLAAPTRRLAHYAAYVLTRHRDPVVIDMGEAELIDSLVSDFRGALSDRRRSDVKARAAALTDKLIGPLRPHLRDYRHWLISPDGSLNLIPVGALLDERGEYLVQQVEISYLTSGRDLLRFNTRSAAKTAAVVVANPTYGEPASQIFNLQSTIQPQRSADLDRSGLVFNPLPGTAQEAAALKTLLKIDSANLLLGSDATEARLKQLHAPRILHIASHGFFLDEQHLQSPISLTRAHVAPPGENPLLRSGIALAGANQRRSGAEDGILTAMEAAQLDLFGTELVVLSACESGVGEVQNGEGVYGLRRALVLAGAQTQIGSLWQVADEPTRKLMVEYYRLLLQGAGRSSALREAQRTMLAMPGRAHPYFWAGFVAIGNPAPLAESVLNRGLSHLDRARFVSRDAWIPVLEMPAQLVVEHRGSYLQQLGVGQN